MMNEIKALRTISLYIFLIPLISINLCLLISTNSYLFDDTIFKVDQIGISKFTIPYIDGSLSISRASRTYPQYLIFKPAMVLTSVLLCFYWVKNNSVVNSFKNSFGKNNAFMIFGIISAFFLVIHSLFLGVETDVRVFKFLRRVVLLSFIVFEIIAQALLVLSFFKLKEKIRDFYSLRILKVKIFLVSFLIIVAILSIPLLIKTGNVHFKHSLEWNYFIGVILFYLLTRLFWKKV